VRRASVDQPWESESESEPSLRCSRRENIVKATLAGVSSLSGMPGKFKPATTRREDTVFGHPLLRHVARIEGRPHSSNQVNTGMTMQVNTGVSATQTPSEANL